MQVYNDEDQHNNMKPKALNPKPRNPETLNSETQQPREPSASQLVESFFLCRPEH